MSEIYQIADAVVAQINAQGTNLFTPAITAARAYDPQVNVEALLATDAPTVWVITPADDFTVLDRDSQIEEVTIGIAVYSKLANSTDPSAAAANALIDPLVKLCRALALLYTPQIDAAGGQWSETKYAPLFDSEKMRQKRVFAAYLVFKFKQSP